MPLGRHGREEIRRNLLRLAAYQALVLDRSGLLAPEGVPASPVECVYEALAVLARLSAGAGACGCAGGREADSEYLVYLLALLARVGFPHMRDEEARSIFLGYLAGALEGGSVEVARADGFCGGIRRRLFGLLGRLRGREGGSGRREGGSLLSVVVRVGVAVYYLGDALEVYRRLAPPCPAPWPRPTSTTSPATSRPPGIRCG